jgi:hypothetical protein
MSAAMALEVLRRSGAVSGTGDDAPLQVTRRHLVLDSQDAGTMTYYAKAIRRFLETCSTNLVNSEPDRLFVRFVVPDSGLREQDWLKFRHLVGERLDPVLHDLDARFGGFEPPAHCEDAISVGVGFFIYKDSLSEVNQPNEPGLAVAVEAETGRTPT